MPVKPDYSGAPQGSILGPLLFHFYINDFFSATHAVSPVMCADDPTLVLSHSNSSSLIKAANDDLSVYTAWFRLNRLPLNVKKKKKSNVVIFSGKSHTLRICLKLPLIQLRCLKFHLQDSWSLLLKTVSVGENKSTGLVEKLVKILV